MAIVPGNAALGQLAVLAILCGALTYFLRAFWRLRQFPGPFWAGVTDLQRAWWAKTGTYHDVVLGLHDCYGDFVRLGPNMVSLSDPGLIPSVYPVRVGMMKASECLGDISSISRVS